MAITQYLSIKLKYIRSTRNLCISYNHTRLRLSVLCRHDHDIISLTCALVTLTSSNDTKDGIGIPKKICITPNDFECFRRANSYSHINYSAMIEQHPRIMVSGFYAPWAVLIVLRCDLLSSFDQLNQLRSHR